MFMGSVCSLCGFLISRSQGSASPETKKLGIYILAVSNVGGSWKQKLLVTIGFQDRLPYTDYGLESK